MANAESSIQKKLEFLETEERLPGKSLRYLVAITASVTSGNYQNIPALVQTCLSKHDSLEDKVEAVMQMREALLKSSAPTGIPKMIIGLKEVSKTVRSDRELTEAVLEQPKTRKDYNIDKFNEKGNNYYGLHEKKSFEENKDYELFPQDFFDYLVVCIHGLLISDYSILNDRDTELCLVGALGIPKCEFAKDFHIKYAMQFEATKEMVDAVNDIAEIIANA